MDSPGFPVGVSNLSPHMYGEKTTLMAACLPAGLSLKTKFIDKKLSETWHANDLGPIEFDGNMLCSEW